MGLVRNKIRQTAEDLRLSSTSERLAHLISGSRAVGGLVLAYEIATAETPHRWAYATIAGALAAGDFIDGWLARRGIQGRSGEEPTKLGKWIDQLSDKVYYHGILGGLAVAAYKSGDASLATVAGASIAATGLRDGIVTYYRSTAPEGANVAARWWGKVKGAAQMTAIVYTASPLAAEGAGHTAAEAALAAATALSIASGYDAVTSLQIAEQPARPAAVVPRDSV